MFDIIGITQKPIRKKCLHVLALLLILPPEQLRFPSIPGFTVRADFAGGEPSSDLGAAMLGAVDQRIGLINRLTAAIVDFRDPRHITHTLRDLLVQRVFQIASGYEDGNDANTLRRDPMFKLAAGHAPLDTDNLLACGATHNIFTSMKAGSEGDVNGAVMPSATGTHRSYLPHSAILSA